MASELARRIAAERKERIREIERMGIGDYVRYDKDGNILPPSNITLREALARKGVVLPPPVEESPKMGD